MTLTATQKTNTLRAYGSILLAAVLVVLRKKKAAKN